MSRVTKKQLKSAGFIVPRNLRSGAELQRAEQECNKKASLGSKYEVKATGTGRPKISQTTYDVWFHHVRSRLLDIDNYDCKDLLDGLVRIGILPDDNPGVVRSVFHTHQKGKINKTYIRVIKEETL
ncbi:MAG: hypothetical protein EBU82_10055 [Flavobacteriia bacterium]|nr:hypothetical protein [Flavobacteriia bacterium]